MAPGDGSEGIGGVSFKNDTFKKGRISIGG